MAAPHEAPPPPAASNFVDRDDDVGPGKRFVGLAPRRYREPMTAVTARLAPEIELTADSDYLTCVFGARQEHFPADEQLFASNGRQLRDLTLSLVDGWRTELRQIMSHQDPASIPIYRCVPAFLREPGKQPA